MKPSFLVLCFLTYSILAQGQGSLHSANKPNIDESTFGKWPFVANASVTNDGNYAVYSVYAPGTGASNTIIQSIHTAWKLNIGSAECTITNDNKFAIFKAANDSLAILRFGSYDIQYLPNVSFVRVPSDGNGKWIAYGIKATKRMMVRNLETKEENLTDSVDNFTFTAGGNALLVEISIGKGDSGIQTLKWVNLADNRSTTFWTEKRGYLKVGNFVFSKHQPYIAFTGERKTESGLVKSIWYYEGGTGKAVPIADSQTKGIDKELSLEGIDYRGFSNDGLNLLITLNESITAKPDPNTTQVDVWSYFDSKLQSQQLKSLRPRSYTAMVNIRDHRIQRLEQENEKIISYNDNNVVLLHTTGDAENEWTWNKAAYSTIYLLDTKKETRKLLNTHLIPTIATSYWLSPAGKYVVYYDADKKNYFSYEIASGTTRNITSGVNATWTTFHKRDIPKAHYMPIYCTGAGWIEDDAAVLLYDQFDIYQVDPLGKYPPINLTNDLGRLRNIEFRLAIENYNQTFKNGEKLVLSAFNRVNKQDGFYRVTIGRNNTPGLLTTQPYIFKGTWEDDRFTPVAPIKARDAEIYLVRRMSAEESPNYFWTNEFKTFNQVTEIRPEKDYNWITSELITWKTPDGTLSQGIFYKPENFDPQKKYPIIFYYYERYSEGLHGFIPPDATHGSLNIPYYVSNGYLVFVPDIYYKVGQPGKSVVSTVVSAANYLTKYPFVDARHMGVQGHSRGGWETNFLITHTNIFAAAMSSSGFADYVSLYNGVRNLSSGVSRQTAFEVLYQRMGATLWERPDLYLENSPIFKVNAVETPLLMMNNKADDDIPFEQGVEFFTALRRLGKKVWMLQYDGEGHIVFDKAAKDLEIRMKQFFDHYLKGAPPPKWMVTGVPAKMKGTVDGLELEQPGVTPGPGLNKAQENK